MLKSGLWRALRHKFELLSNEMQRNSENHWLRAYSECNRDLLSIEERKVLDRGLYCLLDRPEYWVWRLSEGPNESLRARFDALATRAGGTLDGNPPAGISLADFWLDSVFFYLRRKRTDQFSSVDERGACIRNICEASAILSSSLERKALETERRPPRPGNGSAGKRSRRPPRARSRRRNSPPWPAEHRKNLRDPQWLKTQPSLSQKEAAYSLDYSDRYIRTLVKQQKIDQSEKKRIAINEKFSSLFRSRHGGSM